MAVRVNVSPRMLAWAEDRSGHAPDVLRRRFPKLDRWQAQLEQPTFKQLESFAAATHTSLGMLLLPEPPAAVLPVPDYRAPGNAGVRQPSANLLDTIYLCQERQDWCREFARGHGEERLGFLGSMTIQTPEVEAAGAIRSTLDLDATSTASTWSDSFRIIGERLEQVGIFVMASGIVGSNTHRKLDPQEFRGFALADEFAPVIFVNSSDTKAAQIFTLLHETAHLWLGESGVDDSRLDRYSNDAGEHWCNAVAAEVLVPLGSLRESYQNHLGLTEELDRLARLYKVSTLVVCVGSLSGVDGSGAGVWLVIQALVT